MLFSPRVYWRLFELHNAALWPLHVATLAVGLVMMLLWALLSGGVTGAVWVGILAWSRHEKILQRQRRLTEDLERRLEALEQVEPRLLEAEERLDFTERRLVQERERGREERPRA